MVTQYKLRPCCFNSFFKEHMPSVQRVIIPAILAFLLFFSPNKSFSFTCHDESWQRIDRHIYSLQNTHQKEQIVKEYLKSHPDHICALDRLMNIYSRQGSKKQALNAGNSLLEALGKNKTSPSPELLLKMGKLSVEIEDYILAVDYFYRSKTTEGRNELGKLPSNAVDIVKKYIKSSKEKEGLEFIAALKRVFPRLLHNNKELALLIENSKGGVPRLSSSKQEKNNNRADNILKKEKQSKGRLYIKTFPKGAKVRWKRFHDFVYQKQQYKTGLSLRSGKYTIEVSSVGYETKTRAIEIVSGENTNLAVGLVRIKDKKKVVQGKKAKGVRPILSPEKEKKPANTFYTNRGNSVPGNFRWEVGSVYVSSKWKQVLFSRAYKNPVVVVKIVGENDKAPCVVRIKQIDPKVGFYVRIQEWDYMFYKHAEEKVNYIVMEKGSHIIKKGVRVEAGKFTTDEVSSFRHVKFKKDFFIRNPVIIASVASYNEGDAVVGRIHKNKKSGFLYKMQEQESNKKVHAYEAINYIAWELTTGVYSGISFEIGKTKNKVNHKPFSVNFQTSHFRENPKNIPIVLSGMQTYRGRDTATVRSSKITTSGFMTRIEEEKSRDVETAHKNKEVVGYMAFQSP